MAAQESLPTAELLKRFGRRHLKRIESFVGKTLDEAEIPNVMFGPAALCCFGGHPMPFGIDFVVADGRVPDAISALISVGFAPSTETPCPFCHHLERIPCKAHVLFDRKTPVHLFERSDVLWRVPCLDPSEEEMGPERDIMRASHESLPTQRRYSGDDLYPVRIPSFHRCLEACLLNWIDGGLPPEDDPDWEDPTMFWQECIRKIMDYKVHEKHLHMQLLPPSHRKWMEWVLVPANIPSAPWKEVKAALFKDSMLEQAELDAELAAKDQTTKGNGSEKAEKKA